MNTLLLLARLGLFALSLAGWCLWAARRFALPVEQTPLVTISAIGCAMCGAGLLNILTPVRWALTLGEGGAREGLAHVFRFSFAWNEGAAFSMLRSRPWLVVAVSAAVLLFVAGAVFLSRGLSLRVRLSLTLVLAGGLGNLIDRALYGAVVDYIELTFMTFPVFNFADVCVTVGAALFALFTLLPGKREARA